MKKKLLIVSLHLSGGCFQYSNNIISRIKMDKDVYIPKKVLEKHSIKDYKTLLFFGFNPLFRYLSLLFFIIKIIVLGKIGYYHSLLLCGYTSWDYYIIKAWRVTGKPSFFIVHDGKLHAGEGSNKTQLKLLQTIKNSEYLIFLSDYVRQLVKNNFHIDKPYYIAPHGLISYGDIKMKLNDKPVLLFLGRISKYKGIEVLLDAIKLLPSSLYDRLIIAGKSNYKYKVNNIIKGKIDIIDEWLSEEQIKKILSNSDIMIFPYLEATQSGVATIAINYEKPSVVSKVGAFMEQFNDKSALFVEPNNPVELSNAIQDLIINKSLFISIKTELSNLKKKYSWDYITLGLEKFIIKGINNK